MSMGYESKQQAAPHFPPSVAICLHVLELPLFSDTPTEALTTQGQDGVLRVGDIWGDNSVLL